MSNRLKGKKIAILVADGFEQSELAEPKMALEQEGARTQIVSPSNNKVKGWQHVQWGDEYPVDVALAQANAKDFDALVLPGGQMNPDNLRLKPDAIRFIKDFFEAGKPVAAICHGPWTLIDAGVARNRKMTSWPSIKIDLVNAGAEWVDEEVVVDNGLVTSRKPDDLPAFNRKMIEEFEEGPHPGQKQSAFADPKMKASGAG